MGILWDADDRFATPLLRRPELRRPRIGSMQVRDRLRRR
jgi:predicted N-formylglutamate amidohydrolase